MKVLSLFSGGGLGDYGLELSGMKIVGQVEIDDYCQKILKLRWADVPKWTDIKNVRGEEVLERCGAIDLVSGGFPCQDISVANSGGKGIEGERSGLWKEFSRLICEIRPKFVLVENVTNLLGRGLGVVLADLAENGYDAEWFCLSAAELGANHIRDRVWIFAYAVSNGLSEGNRNGRKIITGGGNAQANRKQKQNPSHAGQVCDHVPDSHSKRKLQSKRGKQNKRKRACNLCENVSNASSDRLETGRQTAWIRSARPTKSDWWKIEPAICRVDDGTPKRVDRLKLLGNGQVVQVVEWIGKRIMEFNSKEI